MFDEKHCPIPLNVLDYSSRRIEHTRELIDFTQASFEN